MIDSGGGNRGDRGGIESKCVQGDKVKPQGTLGTLGYLR